MNVNDRIGVRNNTATPIERVFPCIADGSIPKVIGAGNRSINPDGICTASYLNWITEFIITL
jgi:hypothetical protein